MKNIILIISCFCFSLHMEAQEKLSTSPIIFIFDASGSMWGQIDGKTKIAIASEVLSQTVGQFPDDQPVGLVAYGHREKENCEDVEFLLASDNKDKGSVTAALGNIKPLGKTPLAYAAMQVFERISSEHIRATVILLTDGIESCEGDLCEVVRLAKSEGIEFRMHIIGFGLQESETAALHCAASAGDGQYYDAVDAGALGDVLTEATTATIDEGPPNFAILALKNGQPIDAYIKAKRTAGGALEKIARSYGDTVRIFLPGGSYDLEIRPLEGSDVSAVQLNRVLSIEDSLVLHVISFDAGKLEVTTTNNGVGWDAVVRIYDVNTGKSMANGRTYGQPEVFDLNPGLYRVELQALVMKGSDVNKLFEEVEVRAGETMELRHNFLSGKARIGAKSGSGLVDAVVNITDIENGQGVANGRTYTSESSNPKEFILNPGKYEVKLTALGEHKGKSETFPIEIKPEETHEKVITF